MWHSSFSVLATHDRRATSALTSGGAATYASSMFGSAMAPSPRTLPTSPNACAGLTQTACPVSQPMALTPIEAYHAVSSVLTASPSSRVT